MARLTVLTAGHKRKHNACRAGIGGCVGGYTYISRVVAISGIQVWSVLLGRLCVCDLPKKSLEAHDDDSVLLFLQAPAVRTDGA